jgi:hypothetical protein
MSFVAASDWNIHIYNDIEPHIVAGVILRALRDMTEPVVPYNLYEEAMSCTGYLYLIS